MRIAGAERRTELRTPPWGATRAYAAVRAAGDDGDDDDGDGGGGIGGGNRKTRA